MNEVEREFKKAEATHAATEDQKPRARQGLLAGQEGGGKGRAAGEQADYTFLFEEALRKAVSVGRAVQLFQDKDEAMAEDAAAALQGWSDEARGGGDLPSLNDIALVRGSPVTPLVPPRFAGRLL